MKRQRPTSPDRPAAPNASQAPSTPAAPSPLSPEVVLDLLRRILGRAWLDPATRCVIWTGRIDKDGYPVYRRNKKDVRIQRDVWAAVNGRQVRADEVVRHTCDRPSCINPDHLKIGSLAENVADRQARGRQAKGSRNGRSKLTEGQVAAAKRVLAAGTMADVELARLLGVSPSVVRDIKHGTTWSHVKAD